MRLPNAAQEAHPWRIHEITADFILEDVWALPVYGGPGEFGALVEHLASLDPAHARSLLTRALWRTRDQLGRWWGLGRIAAPATGGGGANGQLVIPGTDQFSLVQRLPEDLRGTAAGVGFGSVPFTPLYRTDREFAAELSNQTVHGVIHLAWVSRGENRYQGQMAVYVKPRGLLGKGYMALIKPFRYWIVYPALLRQMERTWNARVPA